MRKNHLEILKDWQSAQEELRRAKLEEGALRNQCISLFSKVNDEFHEGVETVDLGHGLVVKIGHRVEYALVDSDDQIRKSLSRIGRMIGDNLASRLVVFDPRLIMSEYRKLPDKALPLIDRHIEKKPRGKSFEIVK